jgi:hypothetical protein
MEIEIIVKKAILHILDNASQIPVLSNKELDLNDDLQIYLSKHLSKILSDQNLKKASFIEDNNMILSLCKSLSEDDSNLINASAEIANTLFELMSKHIDIPAADIILTIFNLNNTDYLGLLKLNYKKAFTHWVNTIDNGNINSIIQHQTLLPLDNQRIDECFLVNLEDFSLKIIEKQVEINGEKDYYLSKLLLRCTSELSNNSKLKIINKVTKDINKKYFDEDYEKAIQVKKAISDSLENTEKIQIQEVAATVFKESEDIQKEYIEEISKAGIKEQEIILPEKVIEKKFTTQKIKTDTGIEINFPIEYAENQDKIEFINNPDGTISIVIKNIGKITNK